MSNRFAFTAVTMHGEEITGYQVATSRADLLEQLLQRDLYLLRAKKKSARRMGASLSWNQNSNRLRALENLATTLALLLRSRMSLTDSLQVLVSTAERPVALLSIGLLERINSGQTLSQATQAEPTVFGEIYPMLFGLAERTGNLHAAFEQMLTSLRWQKQLKSRLQHLFAYPLMVLLIMSAVMLFLLVTVVPQLVTFVSSVRQELPWHTLVLFWLSQIVQSHWRMSMLLMACLCLLTSLLLGCSRRSRRGFDRSILRLVLLGPLLKKIKFARFFHGMALLSHAQVDLPAALETARPLLRSQVLEAAVVRATSALTQGSRLAHALRDAQLFPELAWRMVEVGEQSGELTDCFQHISDIYDGEIANSLNNIEHYMPPLLILLVGMMLMWLIISVLGPLYDTMIGSGAGFI